MSEETRTHYLTPTYQSVLIAAMQQIREKLAEGDTPGTWTATKALWTLLAPDVKTKLQPEFNTIEKDLVLAQNRTRNPDPLLQTMNQNDAMNRILVQKNRLFLEKTVEVLFRDGYLEKQSIAPLGHEIT